MKKILLVVLSLAMVLSLAACGSSSSSAPAPASSAAEASPAPAPEAPAAPEEAGRLAEIKAAGKIILGTSADYPPFEFHTEINGVDTIAGFDVSLAQKVADGLGVELEIVDMSFDNLLISLNKGDFDFVMASLSNTPERAKAVDFSTPYFHGAQVVVVRAADAGKYATKESLAGCQVAAQKGSIQEGVAGSIAGPENVVLLSKVGDEIAELKSGKVDAVFLDNMMAAGFAAAHDDLVMLDIGIEYESDGNVAAVKKGDTDLADYVSSIFDGLTPDDINALMGEAQALAGIEE